MATAPRASRIARQLNASLGELSFHTDANGVETHRTITPFALFTHKERTGVHAFCHVKEQMRSFYCDRISNLDPLPALKGAAGRHNPMVQLALKLADKQNSGLIVGDRDRRVILRIPPDKKDAVAAAILQAKEDGYQLSVG